MVAFLNSQDGLTYKEVLKFKYYLAYSSHIHDTFLILTIIKHYTNETAHTRFNQKYQNFRPKT